MHRGHPGGEPGHGMNGFGSPGMGGPGGPGMRDYGPGMDGHHGGPGMGGHGGPWMDRHDRGHRPPPPPRRGGCCLLPFMVGTGGLIALIALMVSLIF